MENGFCCCCCCFLLLLSYLYKDTKYLILLWASNIWPTIWGLHNDFCQRLQDKKNQGYINRYQLRLQVFWAHLPKIHPFQQSEDKSGAANRLTDIKHVTVGLQIKGAADMLPSKDKHSTVDTYKNWSQLHFVLKNWQSMLSMSPQPSRHV